MAIIGFTDLLSRKSNTIDDDDGEADEDEVETAVGDDDGLLPADHSVLFCGVGVGVAADGLWL